MSDHYVIEERKPITGDTGGSPLRYGWIVSKRVSNSNLLRHCGYIFKTAEDAINYAEFHIFPPEYVRIIWSAFPDPACYIQIKPIG